MRIGVVGITGKIGSILKELIPADEFSGGIDSKTSRTEVSSIIRNSDVIVDFSSPASTLKVSSSAKEFGVPVVSGTTGFSLEEFEQLRGYSNEISILHASNFSICVQLMSILLKKCSDVLSGFDFSIIDKHHNQKKDAPSGTALFLAQNVSAHAQIVSIRGGNICGDHICDFSGENEMLTISHRAFNRNIFAVGALNCARWIIGKPAGLYSMKDFFDDKFRE